MDERVEDRSRESKKNHIAYYKSLARVISDIEKEKAQEADPAVLGHLNERIGAMKKDQARIKEMFSDVREGEWDAGADWKKSQRASRFASWLQDSPDKAH